MTKEQWSKATREIAPLLDKLRDIAIANDININANAGCDGYSTFAFVTDNGEHYGLLLDGDLCKVDYGIFVQDSFTLKKPSRQEADEDLDNKSI